MWAASVISARLFVHHPPTSSPWHSTELTVSPVLTALRSRAWSRAATATRSIREERVHLVSRQPRAAAEKRELDQERARDDAAAAALHQLDRRARGAPGGEQVVD